MKKIVVLSFVVAVMLSVLNAESVLSSNEAAAVEAGVVKGEAAAQAAVEETQSKDAFEAKQDAKAFKTEAAADEKKVISRPSAAVKDSVAKEEAVAIKNPAVKGEAAAQAAVEETQSKDAFEAKQTAKAFKKEASQDVKKVVK